MPNLYDMDSVKYLITYILMKKTNERIDDDNDDDDVYL
jgi:hypothetical protein